MAETENAAVETRRSRRAGGREARKALRAAPIAKDIRPIRPGMEGGQYRPLSDADLERINAAALEALETIGMAQAIPSCIEAITAKGGVLGDDGRLRFPRALVEDTIAGAARNFPLFGQTPDHDLWPMGRRVYFGTAGAAVHIVDAETRTYRESTLSDLYSAARIVDCLDNIHFFQRPLVARDLESAMALDVNTAYASLSGTAKHIGTSFVFPETVDAVLEIVHMIAGGEEAWRARPFLSQSNCFVVPPLKFAEDACRCLEAAVRGGMPVLLLSAGQAGATAPAAIAGAIVQAVAEVLAGLVYVNALAPGHPAIFGTWPFVSDLRTGAMSGGSGEQALLTAGCAQMARYYDLPGGAAAGIADAKLPDFQAGYERGITNVTAGLAGLNLVYEAAGMHASLLGFSLESLILDDDVLGEAMRCVRGIEVTDATLSLDTMREVCTEGPGHYLGHAQTLSLMQSEYVYPQLSERWSPKEWEEKGRPDLIARAIERRDHILASHRPNHIDPAIDAAIRARFDIRFDAA